MFLSAEDGRRFFRLQQEIDLDECRRVQALRCPDCGGPLDRNDHARKPRGLPFQHFDSDPRRLNLCCRDCRAHNMPESVVYLGRRVYVGVVLVLASILVSGLTPRRLVRVQADLGVSAQTVRRWRQWWQKAYVSHCTSFARSETIAGSGRLSESFVPCALRGESAPGGSYRHSFLSL